MDLTPDPLIVQLRRTLRSALASLAIRSEVQGAPVDDGASSPARGVLEQLGAADLEAPLSAGGLDLGLTAGVLVSEELGRAACGNPYRADAMAADAGCPPGAALAGLENMPVGAGVAAIPRDFGWELTGTAVVDDPEPGPVLVATRMNGRPVLAPVPRGAPGLARVPGCWPPVIRLDATPVAGAEAGAPLDGSPAGPLARARLRQAAYLLGIADGAHEIAVRYAGSRRQFDTRLRDLPAVSFPLARAVVTSRATRALVYRGAWLVDSGNGGADEVGTTPVVALAMAAETARCVVRLCMQCCGVRGLTAELGLHRYFRLAAAESDRYGEPGALWRLAGAARLDQVRRAAGSDRETPWTVAGSVGACAGRDA